MEIEPRGVGDSVKILVDWRVCIAATYDVPSVLVPKGSTLIYDGALA